MEHTEQLTPDEAAAREAANDKKRLADERERVVELERRRDAEQKLAAERIEERRRQMAREDEERARGRR